jgi:perosamine synthetase
VTALRSVTGPGAASLHEPEFAGNEWSYVKQCLDEGMVSSIGGFVNRFEADLAAYTGAGHAVAVVNGTAALHVALRLGGVVPGDEVLIPTLTFAATANAVSYCGAVPHFADSEEATLGLDPGALREHLQAIVERRGAECINRQTGRVIRAVVPVHIFGHPVNVDGVLALAADYGLVVIEDAAESLGSVYGGRHAGTFGRLAALSFNGNKTITTGGGGAILTDDPLVARRAKHLTTTARVPHAWEYRHDEVGYNYRMPNLNAALGCAQLEQLPSFIERQRRLHDLYAAAFTGVHGVRVMTEPRGCRSNYWLQALILDEGGRDLRDAVLTATNGSGLMTRPVWSLMHTLPHFSQCPRMDLAVAESLQERLLNVPSNPYLAGVGHHGGR